MLDQYNPNLVHYNGHWFWKTGNGDLNNQGTHQLDVARWAIDDDQTHPVRAVALGGRFLWNDAGETPNTMFAMAEYPNGQIVLFNVRNVNYKGSQRQVSKEYYLEDGSVITGEGTYKIRRPGGDLADVAEHFGKLHAIMQDGAGLPADGTTYRVGPMLTFDPATERHTGDHAEAATALLKDPNTEGFEIPDADRV